MRYFRYYEDDTLNFLGTHRNGYLVGRKPLIVSFHQLKRNRMNYRKGAGTRLAQRFADSLPPVKCFGGAMRRKKANTMAANTIMAKSLIKKLKGMGL